MIQCRRTRPGSFDDVLAELTAREPIFHRTEWGTSRQWFESTTAQDFWEIGASGRCYDREFVWATLESRYAAGEDDQWRTEDFRLPLLGGNAYLLTYVLYQGERQTRRCTIWERVGGDWRIVYHQGTLVADATPDAG